MNNILSFEQSYAKIAEKIWVYLLEHPNSQDTLEGIAEWWLETHYIRENVELVTHALSYLCARGIVLKEKKDGRGIYYKLNKKHTEEEMLC